MYEGEKAMVRKVDETGSIPKVWEDKVETAEHKPVVHDTEIETAGADSKRGELRYSEQYAKSRVLRACLKSRSNAQSSKHQANHRRINHRLRCFR